MFFYAIIVIKLLTENNLITNQKVYVFMYILFQKCDFSYGMFTMHVIGRRVRTYLH